MEHLNLIPAKMRAYMTLQPGEEAVRQPRYHYQSKVTVTTDPTLLGGVVIKIGNTVCDGSLATQLQSLRNVMVSQAVQKIQAGRERCENGSQSN